MGDDMNLETMKVADLKQMAKEIGLTGYSAMKKADLIAAITSEKADQAAPEEAPSEEVTAAEAPAEEAAAEPAPEPEPVPEEAPAEEAAAEPAPEPEPVPEEAPVEEAAAEPAPAPEPVPEEAPAEEAAAEPAPEPEPVPEEAPVEEAAAEPAPAPVVLSPELIAIKKEKRSLKGQIAEAVSQGDSEKTKSLRNRKKEIRRLLKRKAV